MRFFRHIVTSNEALRCRSIESSLGWNFYGHLYRFLKNGLVGEQRSSRENFYREIVVENLLLDFHWAKTKLPFSPGHVRYED